MKTTILLLLASLCVSNAATYTLSLSPSGTDVLNEDGVGIFNADGSSIAIGGAQVQIGYFSSLPSDFSTLTGADVASVFTTFGSPATARGTEVGGGYVADSSFSVSMSGTVTGSTFSGQSMYAIVSNNSLNLASQILVVNLGLTFDDGDDLGGKTYSFTDNIGNAPVYGSNTQSGSSFNVTGGPPGGTAGGSYSAANSYALAPIQPIPEPSSALLAGLGGLVFLVRRKRA